MATIKKFNRKEQITNNYIKSVAQGGVAGATMEKVSSHCGIRPSALYKHYRNKLAIHRAACIHVESTEPSESHDRFIINSYMAGGKEKDTLFEVLGKAAQNTVSVAFENMAAAV